MHQNQPRTLKIEATGDFWQSRSGEKDKREQSRYWIRLNLAELIKSGNKLSPVEAAP